MSKNTNFQKEMTQVFVSATLADVFTRAVVNGVSGSTEKLDFGDAFLSGAQTGTCFIAYPIAEKLLQKSSTYREKSKNGKGVFTYTSTAVVTAAIIASVNYPISKVQELRKKGATIVSASEFAKLFGDQILPNIGFPVVADKLESALPKAKDSLSQWARSTFIVTTASIGGALANLPVVAARNGPGSLVSEVVGAIGSVPSVVVSNDAFNHFTGVTGFLTA